MMSLPVMDNTFPWTAPTSPGQHLPRPSTVEERAVRILLECFLPLRNFTVDSLFGSSYNRIEIKRKGN